ncbi:MAG: DUF488 family protein [Acidobacteriia bacterium]|jgi:uncharacterized protein YeaO (DUF488 family)|nr:DUF488 family protein [Terriglobia bacterium]
MWKVKRIYDAPARTDGYRVLVDRLWPRGLTRQRAHVDLWLRDVAPSHTLRKQFGHRPDRWKEFQRRYAEELKQKPALLEQLRQLEREHGTVTLLFAARDERRNNAVALVRILQRRPRAPRGKRSSTAR